jgi:large conductance mechanosensitive channel
MATDKTNQVKVTESKDGDVRVTQPQGRKHKGVTVLLDSDDFARGQVGGFVNFLKEYAVVGLALGFIVGQQANGVVKQFVTSFIDPLSKVWFGGSLSSQAATLHHRHEVVNVPWGAFVYVLIEFFLVLFAMYAVIKIFRLDKFAGKKSKKKK